MARARQHSNGRLEDALAAVLRTQASMHQAQASMQQILASAQQNIPTLPQTRTAFLAQMAEMQAESDRRFSRIEAILLEHTRILQEHSRTRAALPDAVREKIGFKPPGQ